MTGHILPLLSLFQVIGLASANEWDGSQTTRMEPPQKSCGKALASADIKMQSRQDRDMCKIKTTKKIYIDKGEKTSTREGTKQTQT